MNQLSAAAMGAVDTQEHRHSLQHLNTEQVVHKSWCHTDNDLNKVTAHTLKHVEINV